MFERQVNDIERKTIDFMKNKLYLVNFFTCKYKIKIKKKKKILIMF